MGYSITRDFYFEAAHSLPRLGEAHKCRRLHGHLFKVEVTVSGDVDPLLGWVVDFGVLDKVGKRIVSGLDHRLLNQVEGLGEPTSENLARYLFEEFSKALPGVSQVTVHESPHSRCTYSPEVPLGERGMTVAVGGDHQLTVSAAHFLIFDNGSRETIHGHNYSFLLTAAVGSGRAEGRQDDLLAAARRALQALDRKLLLPRRPYPRKPASSSSTTMRLTGASFARRSKTSARRSRLSSRPKRHGNSCKRVARAVNPSPCSSPTSTCLRPMDGLSWSGCAAMSTGSLSRSSS